MTGDRFEECIVGARLPGGVYRGQLRHYPVKKRYFIISAAVYGGVVGNAQ